MLRGCGTLMSSRFAQVRHPFEPIIIMTTPSTQREESQFLLLLLQPDSGPGPTPEELQHIMGRFMVWMKELRSKNIVVSTNGLESTGKILRGPRGATVTDGPYGESKEIVGGYILINARDLDHAVEIARGCPGLDHRLAVEVRPVRPQQ